MAYMNDANDGFLPPSQWHLSPGVAGLRAAGAQAGFGIPAGVSSLDALPASVRAQLGLGLVRKPAAPPPPPAKAPKAPKASKAPKAAKDAFRAQDFMSKAQFRKLRERNGFPLNADQHVCHIIAESNGGANHIDNYYVASSSLNQSLGNRNDSYLAEAAGLEQTKRAVAVSRSLGYSGPGAEELIAAAKAARA
jgi:hypothetical protein